MVVHFRCDSFGNRPVTAPSQNRKQFGGRVRSGSTGNRPQVVSNRPWSSQANDNDKQKQTQSNQQKDQTKSTTSRPSSTFTIREPPHQQQAQQQHFNAARKGIFNQNNHSTATAKDLNTKLVQNNKEHNKENVNDVRKSSDDNNDNKTAATSTSNTTGSNANTNSAATTIGVTAGNGNVSKSKQ